MKLICCAYTRLAISQASSSSRMTRRSGRSFGSQARNVDRYLSIIVVDLVFCRHYSSSFGGDDDSEIRGWVEQLTKSGMRSVEAKFTERVSS